MKNHHIFFSNIIEDFSHIVEDGYPGYIEPLISFWSNIDQTRIISISHYSDSVYLSAPNTFRFNSKFSLLSLSLGYQQSFNSENPQVA